MPTKKNPGETRRESRHFERARRDILRRVHDSLVKEGYKSTVDKSDPLARRKMSAYPKKEPTLEISTERALRKFRETLQKAAKLARKAK